MNDHGTADDGPRRLAQLLINTPDERDCQRCLDGLDAYVQAQLAGATAAAALRAVAEHLDQCVACAEAYAVLYEAQLRADWQPEAASPAPDLSFLDRAPGPLTPQQLRQRRLGERLRAALATALEQTSAALRLSFSQPLLDLLAPAPAPGMALRDAQPDDQLFDLELAALSATIERVQITAYRSRQRADTCDLRVQLALPGREWPDLGKIPVILTLPDEQRRALTDAWGEVVFAEIPEAAISQLALEIANPP